MACSGLAGLLDADPVRRRGAVTDRYCAKLADDNVAPGGVAMSVGGHRRGSPVIFRSRTQGSPECQWRPLSESPRDDGRSTFLSTKAAAGAGEKKTTPDVSAAALGELLQVAVPPGPGWPPPSYH